jgi:hypothetical protein
MAGSDSKADQPSEEVDGREVGPADANIAGADD